MPERIPAKKSLGQCFLAERSVAARIASALQLTSDDTVLEIGPGRGILTEELLSTGACVIAVEIDRRLIEPLQERFGSQPKFQLLHEDFLDTDIAAVLPHGPVKVAGNLPYHLVAEVIFKLLIHTRRARGDSALPWIECAVLMMQKEVADRVAAEPGGKVWGKISVFVQVEARSQGLFTVPAGAFRPSPKVDGGVVRLDFLRIPEHVPRDFPTFERMVRFCFSQRRKMLKTSLSALAGIHPFWTRADFDFTRRPETLAPAEWVYLADVVASARAAGAGITP
ncbi:MAG: 16S rRNA (adenine(1518)-N(6)/adenine(1519)-N(6))-dimethyltransferase RsmA [bacterium]|nr:16S rRNA (adenine(1518)-N(6)/adenine(1519)-N(6))-dimethyltransferase RsmA [bacterium]